MGAAAQHAGPHRDGADVQQEARPGGEEEAQGEGRDVEVRHHEAANHHREAAEEVEQHRLQEGEAPGGGADQQPGAAASLRRPSQDRGGQTNVF